MCMHMHVSVRDVCACVYMCMNMYTGVCMIIGMLWKLDIRHNYNYAESTRSLLTISYLLDPLRVPRLTVNTTASTSVEYQVERNDTNTTRVITGYEVFRFGVPMIGVYVNAEESKSVTISPAVPGAQYKITAWALDDGTRRSTTPVVKSTNTREASEPQTLHSWVLWNWTCIQICYR